MPLEGSNEVPLSIHSTKALPPMMDAGQLSIAPEPEIRRWKRNPKRHQNVFQDFYNGLQHPTRYHHVFMSLASNQYQATSSEAALASVSNFRASLRHTSCQQYVNMEYI